MIIVPYLYAGAFRYWAIKATDVRDMGSSPIGPLGQGTNPLLTLTRKQSQQLSTNHNNSAPITTTQHLCKQASSHLEDTSTMQTPSKK
jgi:hypothetical protein